MKTRGPLTFRIFDPGMPSGGREVRVLTIPDQLAPAVEAARAEHDANLAELRRQGEELKAKVTDPVARSALRRVVSGV